MIVTKLPQVVQVGDQPVAIAWKEIAGSHCAIQGFNHGIYLTRLIGVLIPLPLQFAQFAAHAIESIAAVAKGRQIVLRAIQVRAYMGK